ncbi:MAG: cytosine permease, partial [Nitrososphaerota archaeon]
EPVPVEARQLGGLEYFVLWSSLGVGLLVLLAGSFLSSLSLVDVLVVSIIGSVIGSVMLGLAGIMGSRYGVPTMVSLRPVLGMRGSYVPTFLNIVQLVGWTGFEIMIMAQVAGSITHWLLGDAGFPFWAAIFAVWCMFLALGGPLAVVRKWLERYAIWLVYASTVWITYSVFTSPTVGNWMTRAPSPTIPLLLALDIVVAMPISWWPLISDYNRFAIQPRKAFLGTVAGYTVSNTWFYVLGAALVAVLGTGDIISSIGLLFLGNAALILILVDETDNAFADIYSTAVSIQNIFPKVRQWKLVAVTTAAGVALALTVPLLQYEWFLLFIGSVFVPLLGVLAAEYFTSGRKITSVESFYRASGVRYGNIAAWSLGIVAYISIVQLAPSVGASIPSFIVSLLASTAITRLSKSLEKEMAAG